MLYSTYKKIHSTKKKLLALLEAFYNWEMGIPTSCTQESNSIVRHKVNLKHFQKVYAMLPTVNYSSCTFFYHCTYNSSVERTLLLLNEVSLYFWMEGSPLEKECKRYKICNKITKNIILHSIFGK